ncbi:hypothetical protein KEM55_000062, partial [Ascosphaera atra]
KRTASSRSHVTRMKACRCRVLGLLSTSGPPPAGTRRDRRRGEVEMVLRRGGVRDSKGSLGALRRSCRRLC